MENINIIKSKENVLDFVIEIEGIQTDDKKCYMVIKTENVDLQFECHHVSGEQWKVTIPVLDFLEATMYDFYVYMVLDGFYFKPYDGTINVMKSNEIYVKKATNSSLKPLSNITHHDTEAKDHIKKVLDVDIEIPATNVDAPVAEIKNDKEERAKRILEEMGYKSKPSKKKPRRTSLNLKDELAKFKS